MSDPDAGFIAKGQRVPVIGYKPQLARSGAGFITGLLLPKGNASDSGQLVPMFDEVVRRTTAHSRRRQRRRRLREPRQTRMPCVVRASRSSVSTAQRVAPSPHKQTGTATTTLEPATSAPPSSR